jgi:hypothetical protein
VTSVESILETVASYGAKGEPKAVKLFVPAALTFRGEAVRGDVAMAVILNALLAKGFRPKGFEEQVDGRFYLYERA